MRILAIGDVAATGFGRVTRELCRHFLTAGHEVRIIGINHRGKDGEIAAMYQRGASAEAIIARVAELDSDPLERVILPAVAGNRNDGQGWGLVAPAVGGLFTDLDGWRDWRPDVALVVADPRAMMYRLMHDQGALGTLPTFNYVPIEGGDLAPLWASIWSRISPVAMSDFGQAELQRLLGRPVPVAYHGVSDAFYPISPSRPGHAKGEVVTSKEAAKRTFGFAGRTVLLRTDRFVVRKNYPALFAALGPVLERHPDVLLVVHCAPEDEGGLLPELISRLPGAYHVSNTWGHPQVKLTTSHDTFQGLSDADLNVLYNAADIYVSPTMAEGFGLTLAEAAACGVPVVTTDYAAGPEVVGRGGMLVPVRAMMTNAYAHDWALVDESLFGAAVDKLIAHPALRREVGREAARHVSKYRWADAAGVFLGLFEDALVRQAA